MAAIHVPRVKSTIRTEKAGAMSTPPTARFDNGLTPEAVEQDQAAME
jgi:hypothetical protein